MGQLVHGEGLLNMSRDLLYAWAKNLLVSLWNRRIGFAAKNCYNKDIWSSEAEEFLICFSNYVNRSGMFGISNLDMLPRWIKETSVTSS